jgi:hypothetical protein
MQVTTEELGGCFYFDLTEVRNIANWLVEVEVVETTRAKKALRIRAEQSIVVGLKPEGFGKCTSRHY